MTFSASLTEAAPFYNLALVVVVFILFYILFTLPKNNNIYIKPWFFLMLGVIVFIIETVLTIMRNTYSWDKSTFGILFGIFEMAIISLFIYMILLEKEHIQTLK